MIRVALQTKTYCVNKKGGELTQAATPGDFLDAARMAPGRYEDPVVIIGVSSLSPFVFNIEERYA